VLVWNKLTKMPKRGRDGSAKEPKAKRRATDSAKEKAVRRYGADAVAKYYMPRSSASELKGLDTLLTQAQGIVNTTSDASNVVILNLIPPGTGSWNRVGRKVRLQSLRLRGTAIALSGLTATTSNQRFAPLRMVVVWDKSPNGAQPVWSDIFGYTPQSGTEASTVLAPIRYDNTDRFSILCDHMFEIADGTLGSTGGTEADVLMYKTFDKFIKLGGRETVFSGQSATQTIADISTGALYVWFRTVLNDSGTSTWAIDATSIARLRYAD